MKKILYHAVNTYQLMMAITHGLLENKDNERVLILPSFIRRSIPQFEELQKFGFFSTILAVNYTQFNGKDKDYILSRVDETFDRLLTGYTIEAFDEIYVGAAQYYFSIYLINKKRKFNIIEDGAGLLSRHYLLENTIRNQHVLNIELLEQYKMLDCTNSFIRAKLCQKKAQVEGYFDVGMVDFDLEDKLGMIPSEAMERLKEFFRCPHFSGRENIDGLLITQNFANLNQMSFEAQADIYCCLADFFIRTDDIYIKPHPQDIMYYEKLFPKATVIKERFPSELLPYIFPKIPRSLYNISSTGINLIRNEFENVISFDVEFEGFYQNTLKYYIALIIVGYLGFSDFKGVGLNDLLVKNLCNSNSNIKNFIGEDGKIIVVDRVDSFSEEMLHTSPATIFINSLEDYYFADIVSFSSVIPIEIRKYGKSGMESEYLYIYTNDEEIRSMLKEFCYMERLKYSHTDVEIEKMSEEEIYIKTLEGYIRALEKRLNAYIEKVEERK